MSTKQLLIFAALAVAAGRGARAQDLSVSPNPVPLDGAITITLSGVAPGTEVFLFWDQSLGRLTPPNVLLSDNGPRADANGNVTYTFGQLPFRVYPASIGTHTLAVEFTPPFGSPIPIDPNLSFAVAQAQVTVVQRAGWAVAAPLPTKVSPQVSGGLLAFLNLSQDHSSTSIALSDGTATKTWLTFPAGSLVGRPRWSPDGSLLAVAASIDTGPNTNLFVIDRAGHATQETAYGGGPPRLTGGGPGSLTGVALPFLGSTMYASATNPQDDNCGSLLNTMTNPPTANPQFPMVITVNLVGTNFSTAATLHPDAQNPDAYPYRFDNVPEGDYSVRMSYTATVCRQSVKVNPLAGANNPGQPATLVVHDKVIAVVGLAPPVHVSAGQVTQQLMPWRLSALYQQAGSPTWLDGGTVLYSLGTAESDGTGGSISDVWSLPVGGTPVPLTNSTPSNATLIGSLDVSTVTKRVIAEALARNGLLVADVANIATTRNAVTSVAALAAAGGPNVIDATPSWSPDGSYVAFIRSGTITFPDANAVASGILGDLYLKNVATGEEGWLTQLKVANGEGVFGAPAWSPDASQIAVSYTADDFKSVNVRIYNVADASFFDLTQDGRSARPSWTGQGAIAQFPTGVMVGAPMMLAPGGGMTGGRMRGDANGDGKVNVADVSLTLRFAVGLTTPTPDQVAALDFNGNGRVNVSDATHLLSFVVGLVKKL